MFETNVAIPESVLAGVARDAAATKTVKYRGMKFQVKKYLTVDEAFHFSHEVVDGAFVDGEYNPLLKEISVRLAIVGYYTNIELPETGYYDILYADGFMDTICKQIDEEQFYELIFAIDDNVAHLTQTKIGELERKLEPVASVLESLAELSDSINQEDVEAFVAKLSNGGFSEETLVREFVSQMGVATADHLEPFTGGYVEQTSTGDAASK